MKDFITVRRNPNTPLDAPGSSLRASTIIKVEAVKEGTLIYTLVPGVITLTVESPEDVMRKIEGASL